MQATERDLSNINCHYYNNFDHYKNDCADFKAAHQQNRRRKRRQHKQRGRHQPHQPTPGRQQQQRGEGEMWCSYHRTSIHNNYRLLRQSGKQAQTRMPTSPKSIFRVFLGSAARGIFLCETTLTRSLASHSRRERSSLQPSPPKPERRRRRRGPSHSAQSRQQQRRGGELAPDHLLRVLSRLFSLRDR